MDINIVKTDNFDIKNIVYSKSVITGSNKKKISIGYNINGITHDNLHILSPYMTNTMDFLSNHKYQYLKLVFDPFIGAILDFYNIFDSLELSVKNHIFKYNTKYTISSIIKNEYTNDFIDDDDIQLDENFIKCIYIKLINPNNKTKSIYKIYDPNSNECCINSLKNGWKFKCLIKINSIWIDQTKKKYGLNIELVQLKIHQSISQTKCLIDNEELYTKRETFIVSNNELNINQTNMKNIIPIAPSAPNVPNAPIAPPLFNFVKSNKSGSVGITETGSPKQRQKFVPPNPTELLNMKNALKKVLD